MSEKMRVSRRSNALLRTLSTDYLLREQFVTDPAGILSEYVGGEALPAETGDATNHLLYAVFSNPQMLAWLRENAEDSNRSALGNADLAQSFAGAATRSGDPAIASALIRFGSSRELSIVPALDLMRTLILGMRGIGGLSGTESTSGTEATPGTGTQSTPGTGTQSTPGIGTNITQGIATGTEFTPGTGTQSTPGTGTQHSPNPGTGTNSSPGTQSSLGDLIGRWGELQLTVQALVDFSTQLRRSGALNETGLS